MVMEFDPRSGSPFGKNLPISTNKEYKKMDGIIKVVTNKGNGLIN
jgi:hypothetical protein